MAISRITPVVLVALTLAFAPVQAWSAADATAPAEDAMQTTTPESATSPTDPAGPAFATPEAQQPVEAAAEHGEGGLPQLNIATYPSQIFWLLVMFVVLYTAFSKSILPSIGGVVDARDNLINGNLNEAERLKNEAEAVRAGYEKSLEHSRLQAMKAVQDVELNAKKKASDQVEAFRRRADTELKNAEDRVLISRDKAMGDMAHVAAEVASLAAERITGVGTDMQNAKAIVDSIAGKAKAA